MRKTTVFASAVATLALTGVSLTVALAGSVDTPAVVPSPWIGFAVLGAMIAMFVLEIV